MSERRVPLYKLKDYQIIKYVKIYTKKKTFNYNGELIDLSIPQVMGILNITNNSFYDGGRYTTTNAIKKRLSTLIEEKADFIDVGACSTRPNSKYVSEQEEIERLLSTLEIIKKQFPDVQLSIDTFRSNVVNTVYKHFGTFIVNDISGGNFDKKMFETVAKLQLPYILTHIKGTPENMQIYPTYKNIINEVILYLSKKVQALNLLGVKDVIIDPGFGFGKSLQHNYKLLKNMESFHIFELPILVGVSRKSMIYKLLGNTPEDALTGTIALNTIALQKGASILRVHDVKEAVETIKIVSSHSK